MTESKATAVVETPAFAVHVDDGHSDGEMVFQLAGELDCDSAPQLHQAIDALKGRKTRTLVFDLSGLEFIDSSGLHELVVALKRQREAGGELLLRAPRPQTLRVLEIVGLTTVFAVT
jgi:anti-sigma B factor antagonist